MATKTGSSRKQHGRTTKSAKLPAKRSRANAKRGSASAKKAPSKPPKKVTARPKKGVARARAAEGEPKFYVIFKRAIEPQGIYLVPVCVDRLKDSDLNKGETLNDLEVALSRLPPSVTFAHLLDNDDPIFKTCGPST